MIELRHIQIHIATFSRVLHKKVILSVIRLTKREWNFKRKTFRGLLE